MSDLKRVRHRPICCQSSRSALSVQFSGEFCCDRSLGAYYTAVLYVQLTAVQIKLTSMRTVEGYERRHYPEIHTSGQYYRSRRFVISILFPYLSTHNFYCSGICDPILYCSPVSVSSCTVSKLRTRNTQLPATYLQWYTRFGTGAT